MINNFIAEFIGTTFLILIGNAVVANVLLKETKGHNSGWIVITLGWGMAVFVAVYIVGSYSGAHINPAITIGLACVGSFPWKEVPVYILAQMLGAFTGASLVFVVFKERYKKTDDVDLKLATFSTSPAIPNKLSNLVSEIVATYVLVFGVFFITSATVGGEKISLGSLDALPVSLLVLVIGLGLGGTTGYAINPARDLGPRIAHAILPIQGKGSSHFGYVWIPLLGPLIGTLLAAGSYLLLIK